MKTIAYAPFLASLWDGLVRNSRNGTFLFERRFMDYHQHRFEDASLMFLDEEDCVLGLFPANACRSERKIISHAGLTYGGLVLSPWTQLSHVREMFKAAAAYYMANGLRQLIYKPSPHIYHAYPAEEDLYWLNRAGAELASRSVSSAIRLSSPLATELWHRKMKKAACADLRLEEGGEEHLLAFWEIVETVLRERHATRPVHTAAEMLILMQRCPENVRLFTATDVDGHVVTGALLFVTDRVVHVQYMEAGEEARRRRALDWLIHQLIARFVEEGYEYFEFGISTEQGGTVLNEGLAYQKEGFGGRAVCYDSYTLPLQNLMAL